MYLVSSKINVVEIIPLNEDVAKDSFTIEALFM